MGGERAGWGVWEVGGWKTGLRGGRWGKWEGRWVYGPFTVGL